MRNNRKIARDREELARLTQDFWRRQRSRSATPLQNSVYGSRAIRSARDDGGAVLPASGLGLAACSDLSSPRRRPTLALVGVEEIRAMIGTTKLGVYQFTQRPDFPPPIGRIKRRLFWEKADVQNWIRNREMESAT